MLIWRLIRLLPQISYPCDQDHEQARRHLQGPQWPAQEKPAGGCLHLRQGGEHRRHAHVHVASTLRSRLSCPAVRRYAASGRRGLGQRPADPRRPAGHPGGHGPAATPLLHAAMVAWVFPGPRQPRVPMAGARCAARCKRLARMASAAGGGGCLGWAAPVARRPPGHQETRHEPGSTQVRGRAGLGGGLSRHGPCGLLQMGDGGAAGQQRRVLRQRHAVPLLRQPHAVHQQDGGDLRRRRCLLGPERLPGQGQWRAGAVHPVGVQPQRGAGRLHDQPGQPVQRRHVGAGAGRVDHAVRHARPPAAERADAELEHRLRALLHG